MLDLLAAISSSDPPSILAWIILTCAAGMYPVGILLGAGCSSCCPCSCCVGGPDQIVVSIQSSASGSVNIGAVYGCKTGSPCGVQNFSGTIGSEVEGKDCGFCGQGDCSQLSAGTFTLTKTLTNFSCGYGYVAGTRACGSAYVDRVSIACERQTSPASCRIGRYTLEVSWKCLPTSGAEWRTFGDSFDCASFSPTASGNQGTAVFRNTLCPEDCQGTFGGVGLYPSAIDSQCQVWSFCDAAMTVTQQ